MVSTAKSIEMGLQSTQKRVKYDMYLELDLFQMFPFYHSHCESGTKHSGILTLTSPLMSILASNPDIHWDNT